MAEPKSIYHGPMTVAVFNRTDKVRRGDKETDDPKGYRDERVYTGEVAEREDIDKAVGMTAQCRDAPVIRLSRAFKSSEFVPGLGYQTRTGVRDWDFLNSGNPDNPWEFVYEHWESMMVTGQTPAEKSVEKPKKSAAQAA